jgi:hypothetical protein
MKFRDKVLLLYHNQNGICFLCGSFVTLEKNRFTQPTIEHFVPVSKGGSGGSNLRMAHAFCNSIRGNGPIASKTFYLDKLTKCLLKPKKRKHITKLSPRIAHPICSFGPNNHCHCGKRYKSLAAKLCNPRNECEYTDFKPIYLTAK